MRAVREGRCSELTFGASLADKADPTKQEDAKIDRGSRFTPGGRADARMLTHNVG